jgi:glycosyltransferase involved in cell wall biosynthesis
MHILYLHQYFAPLDGSGSTRSYEMARRMVKAGHKVTMITSSAFFPKHYNFTKPTTSLDIEGIKLKVINVPYSNQLSYAQRIKAFIVFAVKALVETGKVKDVDLIFATSTPLTIALPGIFGKYYHKKPMVFEVRDLWPELPIAIGALNNPLLKNMAKWLEHTAYKNSSHVVALSSGMKDGIVKSGFPAGKVTIIPNSCDIELFRKQQTSIDYMPEHFPFPRGCPVVLYAGAFGPINGVEYLVDVAKEMSAINPEVRFVIVGDGRQRKLVIEEARRKGVYKKNIWIIPPVKKNEMPELLAASSIAVSLFINLKEMWNNSANKFFDALAAGRPVMINYEGWQADILRKNGAGIVVPPDNPQEAARILYDFLTDSDRLHKARLAACNLAENDFNRDKLFDKLQKVFIEVVQNKK